MPSKALLDVIVVWHPDDSVGAAVHERLQKHFHSTAFSGLVGGAVEVYARSEGWSGPESAPRPLGVTAPLAASMHPATHTVVVLVQSRELAASVRDIPAWRSYVDDLLQLRPEDGAHVFSVVGGGFDPHATTLGSAAGQRQAFTVLEASSPGLERWICQGIAQALSGESQIRVFVSHTKHQSALEAAGKPLFALVRDVIASTQLGAFFDAQDLQPGSAWEHELDESAQTSALLMVRTDLYASRAWTQREVLLAKRADVPIVGLVALRDGEERGSFLMDHVPTVPCAPDQPEAGIRTALDRLVDESLKRALWRAQSSYDELQGFDWAPVHAPEPSTLSAWLAAHKRDHPADDHVFIVHPDPPLGPSERAVAEELCALAGFDTKVDIVTPRTFAARGGRLHNGE